MNTSMIVLKYVCLLLAIIYGFSDIVRACRGQTISALQILAMGFGVVGYVVLEFELGF